MLPTFKVKSGAVGIELFIQFPDLSDYPVTYLDADEAAGQTTLSANGSDFTAGNIYAVIGNGAEKSELRLVSSATTTTVVVSAAISYAHERGTPIRFIPYNQIIVERSTDGTTYTPLAAVDIKPDATLTYIQRSTDAATDYYKFRFYNSTDDKYSDYSDIQTGAGYGDNTVYAIKKRALDDLGEVKGELITDEYLNASLWEARRELDNDPRVTKWSFRTKFNTDIGNIIPGTWKIVCPTDLRNPNTNQHILGLRIGRNNRQLDYQDFNTFMNNYLAVAHTIVGTTFAANDTSIVLTSSGDFDESGSIDVAAATVAGTIDSIDYTANAETTNTLSGVTGIATGGHAAGVDVWQGVTFGEPQAYTVHDGYIYFDLPFNNDLAGENIYLDYYTTMTVYNSDADELDESEYDLFVDYLKWKIKYKKSNGTLLPQKDGDYLLWSQKKEKMIANQVTGQFLYLIPS